jgi:hypothetical protein
MDNQQETALVAGLYLGEGHFSLCLTKNSSGNRYARREIGVANSDPSIIDFICTFLERHGVLHHIARTSKTNYQVYQIRVTRDTEILKLLEILLPYLVGRKLAEANLLKRFCQINRAKRGGKIGPQEGTSKVRGFKAQHVRCMLTTAEVELCDEKLRMRGSSETTREPACLRKHHWKAEDIVQHAVKAA